MERIGLAPGTGIGGYTVVSPLGTGGMGTVYRALDGEGLPVALKLLHPEAGADPVARTRLTREVQALQRLRHPAVARVLDAEADSTEAFLVTELVEGRSLDEHVRRAGPLPADELADLAEQLAGALAAVHAAGVVHRDLKPSNVMVTAHGPVLIDFGIAATGDTRVTSAGLVPGTPGYLAPELLDGAEPAPSSDHWGLAAVLVFAATGRPPFGTGPMHVVLARSRAGGVDLDGLGPRAAAALRGALAPDPARRTAVQEVVRALREAADSGDEPATVVVTGPASPAAGAAPTQVVAGPAGGATQILDPPSNADGGVVPPPLNGNAAGPVHDGRTRMVPVDADGPVPAVGPQDDDQETWIEEELDASEGQGVGSLYLRPHTHRRWGTLLSLALLAAAAGALYPGRTLVVALVLVVIARTVGSDVEALHARRERLGVRRGDRTRAALAAPWHLLRALLGLVPSLLVAGSVMVVVLGVSWWLIGTGRWAVAGSPRGEPPQGVLATALVGGAVLLGLGLVWFGPLAALTRIGARRALEAVAPRRRGALVVVLLALAVGAVLVRLALDGRPIVWSPLPVPLLPEP